MSEPIPVYRNSSLSVEERVADLLGRMTLEEKVGQMIMWDARPDDLSFITTRQPGSILHILGEKARAAMRLAAQNRLGIPLLIGEDAIHGHSFWKGATIFPTQLALAFVRSRWFVASTILGASTCAQLEENLAAVATPLSAELLAAIDAIHLQFTNPAP